MEVKSKSRRVTQWLLYGDGIFAVGYWVDWRRRFLVVRRDDGFEMIEFKALPGMIVRYEVSSVTQFSASSFYLLENKMRKIAPLSRWWPYNTVCFREEAQALEEYRVRP